MLILGIDPGSVATGWGLIEVADRTARCRDAGVIRPPARRPFPERLLHLHRALAELLDRFAPNEIAVESLFHARSPRTAITLGHARGVILLAAAERGVAVSDYTPLEVKKSVTGRGDASKEQVEAMVRGLVGAPQGLAHDATDALAVALCHLHRSVSSVVST